MQVLVPGVMDPQALQQLTVQRRKEIQRQRLAEYEEAVVVMKAKVKEAEGQAMRETVQDKVLSSTWHFAEICQVTYPSVYISLHALSILLVLGHEENF